jgi:hypothetical protein
MKRFAIFLMLCLCVFTFMPTQTETVVETNKPVARSRLVRIGLDWLRRSAILLFELFRFVKRIALGGWRDALQYPLAVNWLGQRRGILIFKWYGATAFAFPILH